MNKLDSHELLSDLKRVSIELGRTPKRDEYIAQGRFTRHDIDKTFGGYAALIHAAGLDAPRVSEKKITREMVFGRDPVEVVEAHTPKGRIESLEITESILCIGDAHFPWVHKQTLEKIYQFAKENQPKHIVQLGDLFDLYAHSRFPRSLNVYSPNEEIELARKGAEEMWRRLREVCPDAKLYLITGNHDNRPLRNVIAKAPELEALVMAGLKPFFQFDGVQTIDDYRDILEIQGIAFHHGYLSQPGAHRDFNHRNIVTGHTHKGSVTYKPIAGKVLWELNAGFIGDETSKAMSYMPTKATNWTLGWGFIDQWGPRFIPA